MSVDSPPIRLLNRRRVPTCTAVMSSVISWPASRAVPLVALYTPVRTEMSVVFPVRSPPPPLPHCWNPQGRRVETVRPRGSYRVFPILGGARSCESHPLPAPLAPSRPKHSFSSITSDRLWSATLGGWPSRPCVRSSQALCASGSREVSGRAHPTCRGVPCAQGPSPHTAYCLRRLRITTGALSGTSPAATRVSSAPTSSSSSTVPDGRRPAIARSGLSPFERPRDVHPRPHGQGRHASGTHTRAASHARRSAYRTFCSLTAAVAASISLGLASTGASDGRAV